MAEEPVIDAHLVKKTKQKMAHGRNKNKIISFPFSYLTCLGGRSTAWNLTPESKRETVVEFGDPIIFGWLIGREDTVDRDREDNIMVCESIADPAVSPSEVDVLLRE